MEDILRSCSKAEKTALLRDPRKGLRLGVSSPTYRRTLSVSGLLRSFARRLAKDSSPVKRPALSLSLESPMRFLRP